jgi:hypothetical protein
MKSTWRSAFDREPASARELAVLALLDDGSVPVSSAARSPIAA